MLGRPTSPESEKPANLRSDWPDYSITNPTRITVRGAKGAHGDSLIKFHSLYPRPETVLSSAQRLAYPLEFPDSSVVLQLRQKMWPVA